MSRRKNYPVLGTEGASYPYPQIESVVLNYFNEAMDTASGGKCDVVCPLYRDVHNTLVKSRSKPKTALDMALALPPAEFLMQHEAYLTDSGNDSGINNGLILHGFLASIRATTGLKYALIINPSVNFSQALRATSIPASYHITCLYDEQVASVYQMDGTLRSFDVATLQTVNREKNYDNILIFQRNSSASELKSLLINLFPGGLPPRSTLYVVMPTTTLSGQRAKPLRDFLAYRFPLNHILVVDPNATHAPPSKRCVLTFHRGCELSIQRAKLVRKQFLHTGPNHIISRDVFVECDKPLHQLSADVERRGTTIGDRTHAEQFALSKHIVLMYRIEKQREDKYRVVAYYTSVGTPNQQRKNILGRGRRISKFYRSHSMSSPQAIEPFLWNLLWNDELSAIIRKDIRDNVNTGSLDIPTLWYLHHPDLLKSEVYQQHECSEFIRSLSPTDGLYKVELDSAAELVHTAVIDYAQKHGLSGNRQRSLIIQLRLIANQACIHKYCPTNPFREIVDNYERKRHEHSSLAEASALRTIEQNCMDRLKEFLAARNDLTLNALIALKLHTGLPSSEIGALNWGDLEHMTNMDFKVLMVSKRLPASGNIPIVFSALEQNRVIPLPQIAAEIQQYRRAEVKLARADGISDKDFEQLPMFHVPDDRTRRLTKNGINKMLKPAKDALGIEQNCVPLPNGESIELHDINRYGGDLFRAFYDARIRDVALLPDDMAYLYGTTLHSVACMNYRDYLHPLTQLILHQLQNRCANVQNAGVDIGTNRQEWCIDPANSHTLIINTASVRTETVITISIPPDSDISTLCAKIQCRFGMDISVSFRPHP